jgi:hypothetical protein
LSIIEIASGPAGNFFNLKQARGWPAGKRPYEEHSEKAVVTRQPRCFAPRCDWAGVAMAVTWRLDGVRIARHHDKVVGQTLNSGAGPKGAGQEARNNEAK